MPQHAGLETATKTFCICKYLYQLISNIVCKVMLIKSFVTVAVTSSYRNKNWELKLRREGNDMDSVQLFSNSNQV